MLLFTVQAEIMWLEAHNISGGKLWFHGAYGSSCGEFETGYHQFTSKITNIFALIVSYFCLVFRNEIIFLLFVFIHDI